MSKLAWPDEGVREVRVSVADARCVGCNQRGEADDLRRRKVRSLSGPIELSVPIRICVEPGCELLGQRIGAEVEYAVAPPHWTVTWDLFAWMGHRRFGRHWSVPQIRLELHDRFSLAVSDDWVEDAVLRYQVILAAREGDVARMREEYATVSDVILTIDGLQPEKGHETLYVVRELRLGRVWFAEPLLSSSAAEVRRLFERAKEIASSLGKPVRCWMSDKQRAFVTGVAEVFAGVPHRYCNNHFLRDLAKPILERDSHAKVQMRRKVRGLREIEKSVLVDVRSEQQADKSALERTQRPSMMANGELPKAPCDPTSIQREVVLEYCEAVRGILSDDQGGPLNPPGVRMDVALGEVQHSIERLIESKKGGRATRQPRLGSATRRVDAR